MKKFKKWLATGCLCMGLVWAMEGDVVASQGVALSQTVVEDSVRQLDIMAGDFSGNLNLSKEVSRAEFATMLVAASSYKDVTTHFGYTLFPDVPSTYWASGYIKVVVEQGYMVGYLDGTFGPKQTVLLEEAVTAVLNLLGYNASTLSGTYPQAQLAKFYQLDLDEYMTVKQGEPITREQCMYLFFNLMNTNTLQGTPYASQMGYATTSTGDLDTIALTNKNTTGPYLVGKSVLPTALDNVTRIYRNDKDATLSEMEHYDICYYNEKLSTLWIYSEKITGRLTGIHSTLNPTSVTVAGQTYDLETTEVIHKFSSGSEFREGDLVTLLLGKDGKVSDCISANLTDGTIVGVVLGRGVAQYGSSEALYSSNYVQLITTDGEIHEFDSGGKYYEAGRVIEVTYKTGVQSTRGITDKTVEGKVNSNATYLGEHKLADDIQIFEVSEGSSTYGKVYLSRLAGYTIEKEDVRYYTTNTKGEIDSLILQDCTGDLGVFPLLTKVSEVNSGMTMVGQYTYLLNGVSGFEYTDTKVYKVSKGGALFEYEDGAVCNISKLEAETVTYINALDANINGRIYPLSDNLQVYEYFNYGYHVVKLEDVDDLSRFNLTAYYDKDVFSAGGHVRIIVAEANK